MERRRILIVDDERGVRESLALLLEDEGFSARGAADADAALAAVERERFDVVLLDVRMPGRSGIELLPELRKCQPDATLLVMSAFGDVDQALAAVRAGAWDFLTKPFRADELLLAIHKAEERERLHRENRRLRSELARERVGARVLVAASDAMKQVYDLCEHAAEYKTTVLVTGESGVGKELVARTIHDGSARATQPFVAVNCGAIPDSLIEAELFGHARGAFTGADQSKPGLFREANGGTLFLDEVGELPPAVQVTLLRALQEEEVRPLGEGKPVAVDVRIIAATSRDLEAEVREGRFRPDLFYRLNVFRIHVPPLRERALDLPVLADELLRVLARRTGKAMEGIEDAALARLRGHRWPGNVRELENVLERAVILARGPRITPELIALGAPGAELQTGAPGAEAAGADAPGAQRRAQPSTAGACDAGEDGADLSVKRRLRALEEALIRKALERTGGNRTQAARLLELSPRALQYKVKEYAIQPLNPRSEGADPGRS
jgi:two-component system response regulator AtoC